MFVHMSVHYPLPGKEQFLLESMNRYGKAMEGKPGLQQCHALKDETTGKLVGLAIWDSKEQWEAAYPDMHQAVKDDPFHEWEEVPPKVYHLNKA